MIMCTAFDLICRRQRGGGGETTTAFNQYAVRQLKPTKDSLTRIKRFQKEDIKIYFLKVAGEGGKKLK